MALAIKTLFDKRKVALTRARFRAWWEGEAFDEEAATAAITRQLCEQAANDADDELFDEPAYRLPPRLVALEALWGEGRVRPGDATAEAMAPARLGLGPDSVLAFLGPGLAEPVKTLASAHGGRIDVFEWREETNEALAYGVKSSKLAARVTVSRIDLDALALPPETYDGLLSIDDFAYCGYPPRLAQQFAKILRPGATAVVETYVGLRAEELATAFASSFAEPQIRAHGDLLQFFTDAGLEIEADEELTDEFVALARASFKALGERLTDGRGLDPATAQELAWETEAWRARLRLLVQRRLERRRFILRKPASKDAAIPNPKEEAAA